MQWLTFLRDGIPNIVDNCNQPNPDQADVNKDLIGDACQSQPLPDMPFIPIGGDFDGYVWGVGFANSNAYRADPTTGDVQTFNQLVGAYTYSDMTGFALNSAGSEPPEG